MSGKFDNFFSKKWSYPLVYILMIILNTIVSPIASKGYAPQDTGKVIISLLKISTKPYEWLAPIFHIATIILVIVIWRYGAKINRIFSVYVGANYIFIAFTQMIGETWEYGLVIMIGALISYVIIGLLWFWEASNPKTETSFKKLPWWRYWSIPLAVLAFWSPIGPKDNMSPYFDPLYLLISPMYGLTFCLTTPVLLFLLTLFYPQVNKPVYKINAFVGIIYGVYNMQFLFDPYMVWMGVLHFPLLFISIYAFFLPRILKEKPLSDK